MKIPTADLRVKDTHRLIASRYSATGTVLSRLSANAETLGQLLELDDATNDRFLGEEGLLPGIGIHELVYGIRYAHIVNAAFTHASPTGGRFNSPTRGAWYASLDRPTSLAEIAFHKLRHLEEIDWPYEEISTSDDYLADITSPFHDLRNLDLQSAITSGAPSMTDPMTGPWIGSSGNPSGNPREAGAPSMTALPSWVGSLGETSGQPRGAGAPSMTASPSWVGSPGEAPGRPREAGAPSMTASPSWVGSSGETSGHPTNPQTPFLRYLQPDPIPACYRRSQQLADRLLARRSNGIIYPSVRRPGGTCLAIFRPALVYNVRRGARLELRLQQNRPFRPSQAREVPFT